MDPNSGKVKRWVYMGINPYGAVIDSSRHSWARIRAAVEVSCEASIPTTSIPSDNTDWNNASSSNRWEANELGPVRTHHGETAVITVLPLMAKTGSTSEATDRIIGPRPNTTQPIIRGKSSSHQAPVAAGTQVQAWGAASQLVPMALSGCPTWRLE